MGKCSGRVEWGEMNEPRSCRQKSRWKRRTGWCDTTHMGITLAPFPAICDLLCHYYFIFWFVVSMLLILPPVLSFHVLWALSWINLMKIILHLLCDFFQKCHSADHTIFPFESRFTDVYSITFLNKDSIISPITIIKHYGLDPICLHLYIYKLN